MELRNRRILLISPQSWDGLHMSKHHLAKALADRSNQVVFLDPPTQGMRGLHLRRVENVQVVTYGHWLRGANRMPKLIHKWYYQRLVEQVASSTGGLFDVIWCFDTSRMQWFPDGQGIPVLHLADIDILHQGHGLMKGAQLVLTVSDRIRRKVLEIAPDARVHNVGHALDEAWFSGQKADDAIVQVPRTVAYAGQMQWNYVDWPSLHRVVEEHPALVFHFYGPFRDDLPDAAFRSVRRLHNAHFHGLVPKTTLMPALHAADILLLCYRNDLPLGLGSNSHKLLEYLATGNVIVTSYVPHYAEEADLLSMVGPADDYKAVFDRAVNEFAAQTAPDKRLARKSFARTHTFPRLLEQVEQWLTV